MEKDTFTFAELTGLSFWEASLPLLILVAIFIVIVSIDLLYTIYQDKLRRLSFKIRYRIADFIFPEMEVTVNHLENQIDGMKMDAEQDHYWSTN